MRFGMIALAAAGVLGVCISSAAANDGCGIDRYGRYYCQPGARPGVPYYGGRQYAPQYQGGYYGQPYRGRREKYNPCPPYWTVQNGVCKPYRGY